MLRLSSPFALIQANSRPDSSMTTACFRDASTAQGYGDDLAALHLLQSGQIWRCWNIGCGGKIATVCCILKMHFEILYY